MNLNLLLPEGISNLAKVYVTYVTYLAVKECTYDLEQLQFYITFTEIFTA